MQMVGIIILVFVTCLIAFSVQGCRGSSKPAGRPNAPIITVQQVDFMSRAQIEKMLGYLQKQKAPKQTMGAMCYKVAAPPSTAEYVCPVCGQKTLYSIEEARFVEWELESCRREFDQVKKASDLKMVLDESSFCAQCSPNAEKHELVLKIGYSDGSTHSAGGIQQTDLRILHYFLSGSLSFRTRNDAKVPLKDQIPRLRELLGVDDPAAKGKP